MLLANLLAKHAARCTQSRARRRPDALSREQVMEAALRVADAEGLSEVSMARVAHELRVPGTSVYRQSEGRHDLIIGL